MKIKCAPKGPYLLEGPVEIEGTDGTIHAIEAGRRAALCRCGGSVNKPFCDGTHSKLGFEAAEAAVRDG